MLLRALFGKFRNCVRTEITKQLQAPVPVLAFFLTKESFSLFKQFFFPIWDLFPPLTEDFNPSSAQTPLPFGLSPPPPYKTEHFWLRGALPGPVGSQPEIRKIFRTRPEFPVALPGLCSGRFLPFPVSIGRVEREFGAAAVHVLHGASCWLCPPRYSQKPGSRERPFPAPGTAPPPAASMENPIPIIPAPPCNAPTPFRVTQRRIPTSHRLGKSRFFHAQHAFPTFPAAGEPFPGSGTRQWLSQGVQPAPNSSQKSFLGAGAAPGSLRRGLSAGPALPLHIPSRNSFPGKAFPEGYKCRIRSLHL